MMTICKLTNIYLFVQYSYLIMPQSCQMMHFFHTIARKSSTSMPFQNFNNCLSQWDIWKLDCKHIVWLKYFVVFCLSWLAIWKWLPINLQGQILVYLHTKIRCWTSLHMLWVGCIDRCAFHRGFSTTKLHLYILYSQYRSEIWRADTLVLIRK